MHMTIAVVSLLIVLVISLIITRLAALALSLTGMSHESARFQARSALACTGFTTHESENIVNHPVRRQIIMWLMLTGSIGIPAVVATIVVSFLTSFQTEHWVSPLLLLATGLATLGFVSHSKWVEKNLNAALAWCLKRWTHLDVSDYISLLQLQNGYGVTEIRIKQGDWLDRKTLQEAGLSRKGILVLGIKRPDESYVGTPLANDAVQAGDTIVIYSRLDRLKDLEHQNRQAEGTPRLPD